MKRQNVRVVLGSEHPEMRSFLKRMVETDKNVTVVGEGENAIKMLTETRRLRPDVAIIDSYLPHNIGLDALPLSRVGGLDTAQIISEEIQNTQVILLNRPRDRIFSEDGSGDSFSALFYKDDDGQAPFTISELSDSAMSPRPLVFAHVKAGAETTPRQGRLYRAGEKSFFLGTVGVLGGSFLALNIGLGPAGFLLGAVAGAAMLFGLVAMLFCKAPE